MSATTLQQTEAAVDDYPEVTVSTEAEPFLPAAWARIEGYVTLRTTERAVTWVVEGCGSWVPPLRPTTIATVERWTGTAWEATTLQPSALGGYILAGAEQFRFVGVAGDDDADVPPLITEAVRRLAEFMAATTFDDVGLRGETVPDVWTGEYGSPSWRARALQDSGAADLLRQFRRA